MEGGGDLPRLVDFLSKSAILALFIEQNWPIPTTGSSSFSPAFTGFSKGFTLLKGQLSVSCQEIPHQEIVFDLLRSPSCARVAGPGSTVKGSGGRSAGGKRGPEGSRAGEGHGRTGWVDQIAAMGSARSAIAIATGQDGEDRNPTTG